MPIVYKVTFPNGKIYVGQDRTDTITYFGSPDAARIAQDFTPEERRVFTVTREVLWSSIEATRSEINQKEQEMIRSLHANDPDIGYNQTPRRRTRKGPP